MMKKYVTAYYLLFVLLVMGAFASMAFNAYGTKLMGIACLGFSFTFLHEAIFNAGREDLDKPEKVWLSLELISLSFISLLFFSKGFFLGLVGTNEAFLLFSLVLLFLVSREAWIQLKLAFDQHWKWGCILLFYFGTVELFILSFIFGTILPGTRTVFASFAVILLVSFILALFVFRRVMVNGDNVSAWGYIAKMKNKWIILVFSCLLIYGYGFLSASNVLPSLYYSKLPNGYIRWVERGNLENAERARQKEREFRERYEQLVEKYSEKSN